MLIKKSALKGDKEIPAKVICISHLNLNPFDIPL